MTDAKMPPDGFALTKLRCNEIACEECVRAVWDGKDVDACIGWIAPCGRRVARYLDCGTVQCPDDDEFAERVP